MPGECKQRKFSTDGGYRPNGLIKCKGYHLKRELKQQPHTKGEKLNENEITDLQKIGELVPVYTASHPISLYSPNTQQLLKFAEYHRITFYMASYSKRLFSKN
jgi:hypothetical protein